MSKIVVLNASPRKNGNCSALINAMTDGAMGLSTNEIYIHNLDDMRIAHGCKSCYACKKTGKCVQNDDVTPVLEDVRTADIIIAATPLYFGHAAAQYRILEDRFFSFLRPDFSTVLEKGKKIAVIVTCGSGIEDAKIVAKNIEGVYKRFGFESLGTIVYAEGADHKHASKDVETCKKARDIGRLMRNN